MVLNKAIMSSSFGVRLIVDRFRKLIDSIPIRNKHDYVYGIKKVQGYLVKLKYYFRGENTENSRLYINLHYQNISEYTI